jgi:hypothetical protein
MKAELNLWRTGIALLGGRFAAVSVGVSILVGFVAAIYVWNYPVRLTDRWVSLFLTFTSVFSHVALLLLSLATGSLWSRSRTLPLLQLVPGARSLRRALQVRLAGLMLLAFLPALILRVVLALKWAPTVYLADATFDDWLLMVAFLLYGQIFAFLAIGPLKIPPNMATIICYSLYMPGSLRFWWLPLVMLLVFIGVRWLWKNINEGLDGAPARQRMRSTTFARGASLLAWWRSRDAARASRRIGPGSAGQRVGALLSGQRVDLLSVIAIFGVVAYLAFAPAFMRFGMTWYFAYMIAALVARPALLPFGRVLLLPLGAERARMGGIIAAVWLRDVHFRLLVGVSLGLFVHAFCWWVEWPGFLRTPSMQVGSATYQLLWNPLSHAFALYGIALSASLLASASPRWLENSSFLTIMQIGVMFGFAIVGLSIKWAINEAFPASAAHEADHLVFVLVNSVMLPITVWIIHRALRPQWKTANLAAITSAMQKYSANLQKAFSTK